MKEILKEKIKELEISLKYNQQKVIELTEILRILKKELISEQR